MVDRIRDQWLNLIHIRKLLLPPIIERSHIASQASKQSQAKETPPTFTLLADLKPQPPRRCACPKIIPDPNGIYHGAFLADTISGPALKHFESMSGQSLDIGLKFMGFPTGLFFPTQEAQLMSQRGGALFIKLEPWSWKGKTDNSYSLSNIVAKKYDSIIMRFAQGAAAFGKPVFVSFGHEMNGNWYPWSGNPRLFVKAWRHIHGLVSRFACNVTWVWNVNIDFPNIKAYYPGARFVDWVAVDGYSYDTGDRNTRWRSFPQLFSTSLKTLASFGKPIMIGEVASDTSSARDKEIRKSRFLTNAITHMANRLLTRSSTPIHAFVYLNKNMSKSGKHYRWAISTATSQNAYRKVLQKFGRLFADRIKTSCKRSAAIPPQPMPQSAKPISIDSIRKAEFSFNGGSIVRKPGGNYVFTAKRAKDPGFVILMEKGAVGKHQYLKFETQGALKRHGKYARFIVQVYDHKDSDTSPSTGLDPVAVSQTNTTISVPIRGLVSKIKKIQFMLISDRGSCNIQIKSLRLE